MSKSTQFNGKLYQRMADDLHLAGMSQRTHDGYLRAVRQLADYCTRVGVLRRSVYQMIAPIDKVLDGGNCGRVTDRGEEACECVPKYRPDIAVGRILVKAARLRTETSYKAGSGRQACTTSRSRSQTPVQVNDELVQRKTTLLSGEICRGGMRAVAARIGKACLKTPNGWAKADSGAAEVSRGRSTDPQNPIETGRTER